MQLTTIIKGLPMVCWLCACGPDNTADAGGGSSDDKSLAAGADGGAGGGESGLLPFPLSGIWKPKPRTTWQWQILEPIDTSFDVAMYDIDLFDAPPAKINELKLKKRVVICYFSAGSYEDGRPDAAQFPAEVLGNSLAGWSGERWLDTRNPKVRALMKARLDLAVQKGCDGVEPDNVDGYRNNPGFSLTAATQLDYNRFLATEAHARGLSVGLKNDLAQVEDLQDWFDWALNEGCYKFKECDMLTPFIRAEKAVFHVEYGKASLASSVCSATRRLGFSSLIKNLKLDSWRVACP